MYSLLELRHLSKNYPPQSVLSDIQLELQTGEILGLLGESGSGKSTLLRLAAGLIDPDEGEIWLNGEKLRLASDQLIPGHPDIKIVHQDYNLSLPISVRENIAYALRYYQKVYRDERVDELIELCHLETVADKPAKSLSGGEKQRTAIARALAEEAKVLLLDEPFAHLDFANRRRLTQTIRTLAEETGTACIFVTHDAPDALSLSDRMGILYQGKLLQVGTPQEVYQQPVSEYVAELTGEINVVHRSTFEQFFGTPPQPSDTLLIRPEQLTITETKGTHGIWATVQRSIFEGSRYRIQLIADQQSFIVYAPIAFPKEKSVFLRYIFPTTY